MQRIVRISVLVLTLFVVRSAAQEVPKDYIFSDYGRMINTFSEDTAIIWNQMRQGNVYLSTKPDSALKHFNSAFNTSRNIGLNEGMAKTLLNISACYSDYNKSIPICMLALKYCHDWVCHQQNKSNLSDVQSMLYTNLSTAYFYKEQFDLAAYYSYKILEIGQFYNKESRRRIQGAYLSLGNIFTRVGKFDQALYYDNMGIQLASMYKDTVQLAMIWGNVSSLYLGHTDIIRAKYYSRKVLQAAAQVKDIPTPWDTVAIKTATITASDNMAMLLIQTDSPALAIPHALEALRISKQMGDQKLDGKLNAEYALGYAYCRLKQYRRAEQYLLPALNEAKEKNILENLENPHSILALLYSNTGQYKKAFEHQLAYSKLEDSLHEGRNTQLLNDLEVKNQLIEKDKTLIQKQLLLTQQDNQIKVKNFWIGGVSVSAILLGLLTISRYRNRQRLQERRIRILQQEQEIVQLKAMMDGEEKERMRIARDLHDGVSQTMSAAKMNIIAIEGEIVFKNQVQKAKFEKIINLVDSSFKEVRTISHNMMPNALREAGLALVIKQFVDNIDSDVIKINLYCKGLDEHFDNSIETILYRVIQECVNNVIKHSKASRLDISLNKDEDGVSLTIEDNGIGFDIADTKGGGGIGLKNIEARIHFLQGQVEFDSAPGNGTLVSIHVPLHSTNSSSDDNA